LPLALPHDLTREELRDFINFLLNESRHRQESLENRVEPALAALSMAKAVEGNPDLELRFLQMLRLMEFSERVSGVKLRF